MSRRALKKSYLIVVDGETEKWYLDLLREYESNKIPTIHIKPEIPKKKKLNKLFEQVIENEKIYDKVIWIIDFDVILREKKAEQFSGYQKELKKHKNVNVIINTPCLEFWFLLHFFNTGKFYPDCKSVINKLKQEPSFKKYNKSEKYYKSGEGIYKKLNPFINKALSRSKSLDTYNSENPKTAVCEMYKLFDELGIFSHK